LKNPINIESAINSIIPGSTASQMESLKFLYGYAIAAKQILENDVTYHNRIEKQSHQVG